MVPVCLSPSPPPCWWRWLCFSTRHRCVRAARHRRGVDALLRLGQSPNKRNASGFTPAGLARMNGHAECLQLIAQYDDGAMGGTTPINAPGALD
jgi:hypothetical protein